MLHTLFHVYSVAAIKKYIVGLVIKFSSDPETAEVSNPVTIYYSDVQWTGCLYVHLQCTRSSNWCD